MEREYSVVEVGTAQRASPFVSSQDEFRANSTAMVGYSETVSLVGREIASLICAILPLMEPRRTREEIGLVVVFVAVMAGIIAAFVKGSRRVQPLATEHSGTSHPLTNALVAVFSPAISAFIFSFGVWLHFTNNRLFDLLVALPLVTGAYCGRRAFRSTQASVSVRALALLATIVCVPGALLFLFITFFGVG